MRVTLNYEDFETIMKATKDYVAKTPGALPDVYTRVMLKYEDRGLVATALDGTKCVEVLVAAQERESDEEGTMLIPWIKPPGRKNCGRYLTLSETEDAVVLQDNLGGTRYYTKEEKLAFMDTDLFFDDKFTDKSCFFEPKMLAKALAAFDCKAVNVMFLGDMEGVIISSVDTKQRAIVLPLNPKKVKKIFEKEFE